MTYWYCFIWLCFQHLANQDAIDIIYVYFAISIHCVKSVQIRSFVWSLFSRIRTEYREILRSSPFSVRMRENTEQKNSVFGHFSSCYFWICFLFEKGSCFRRCPTFTYRHVSSDHIKTKSDANCNLEEIIGQEVNNLGGGRALFSFVSYSVHWVDMYFFFDNFHVIVKLPGKVSALL